MERKMASSARNSAPEVVAEAAEQVEEEAATHKREYATSTWS
ncbi:hypothetical protein PI125_g8692 [Phytophthora idaei]|nr:hypothetical protein PI125_g8692 [Phytophthora idaei]